MSLQAFWRDRPWRLRAAVVVLSAALVGLLQVSAGSGLAVLEETIGDLTWRLGSGGQPERRVVVVDIDEASLDRVGPWPWPRATLARLSEQLDQAGAAVQAFDLVLDAAREGDAVLAEVWRRVPVVTGQVFSLTPLTTPRVGTVAGGLAAENCPPFAPASHGHVASNPTLLSARMALGHLTPFVERDGVVRKVPALVCHEGRAYPSLALATLWRAAQTPSGEPSVPDWTWHRPGEPATSWIDLTPWHRLTSPSLPGVEVPLDAHGQMRVPFRIDRRAFASVSAHKVLDGTADPALLRGAIILVGATGFGIVDVTATPLSAVAAGVEVHAQAIAGLLDHRVPFTPRQAPVIQALAALLGVGLMLALAARRPGVPVKRLPIAGLVIAAGLYVGAASALWFGDVWLPWLLPALFVLLAAVTLATAEHALTRAQRERLSAHLGSYLPAPVAERLMAVDPSGSIEVDQRNVSVLVADIRNFSAFAAHRPTQETAALLHAFYCTAVDVVEQHGGVVENVSGDSILAVWNAYSDCPQHPRQAFDAAKELVRATRALLARPVAPEQDPLVQPLALGVGLESGTAIVGSFGPARRRSHAALGEPVSVASRLQQMTQDLSIPILVGPAMAHELPAEQTEALGDYLLEGMSLQYALYAPADWADLVPSEQLWAAAVSSRADDATGDSWADLAGNARNLSLARIPHSDV